MLLYSKRLGGAGTGIVALNKDRTEETSLRDAFNVPGTYRTGDLARAYGAMWYETKQTARFANHFGELLVNPALWGFKGKGTYIDSLCKDITDRIRADKALKKHFKIMYSSSPRKSGGRHTPWNSSRTLSFKKRPGSNVSVKQLADKLREKRIYVDWFSMKEEPAKEYYEEILEITRKPYSEKRCECLCNAIMDFELHYPELVIDKTLGLREIYAGGNIEYTEDLYWRQIRRFKEAVGSQEMIRILVDITTRKGDICSFLEEFADITSSLTSSSSQPSRPDQTLSS